MKIDRQWFFPMCNTAFNGTLAVFSDFKVENRERLNVDGPVIYVSNHISNLDPPVVASILPRRARFLAKREIFSNPLFNFLLRGWGAYPVSRYSADLRALRWARSILNQGMALVLFPEGTRSRDMQGLKAGQIGAGMLAEQTNATIVPIGLHGTDSMQNVLRVVMPISTIRISVGEPFKVTTSVKERQQLQQLTDEIMARIARQLPPARRGVYADRVAQQFVLTDNVEPTNAPASDASSTAVTARSTTRNDSR